MSNVERTFVMIKPGGVRRGLIGTIIQRFENKGLKLVGMKQTWPAEQRFRQHYEDLEGKEYFERLVRYMTSAPVVAMVWEGWDVVKNVRQMIGASPLPSAERDAPPPGSIRGDYCSQIGHGTVIHASDSPTAAEKEIYLWFTDKELIGSSSKPSVEDRGFFE